MGLSLMWWVWWGSRLGRLVRVASGGFCETWTVVLRFFFSVKELAKTKVIFEDDDILVVDKPAFITADEVAKTFKDAILLNRLDKETSGVMMFAKNEEFQKKL